MPERSKARDPDAHKRPPVSEEPNSDTIVALSTPPGTSGLAVLRLSGPACRVRRRSRIWAAAIRIPGMSITRAFRAASPGAPASGHSAPTGEILDRLNFVFFPGPASSTGEDVLELYPHGNMLLVDRLLKALLDHPGVRLAGPGEFTRRGFESGKIDLLQAEAVGQLIHAQTVEALRNAQRIAAGGLSAPLKALRDALVDLSVRLELDVDFSEEEAGSGLCLLGSAPGRGADDPGQAGGRFRSGPQPGARPRAW